MLRQLYDSASNRSMFEKVSDEEGKSLSMFYFCNKAQIYFNATVLKQ